MTRSLGPVVIWLDTNSPEDFDLARGQQVLAGKNGITARTSYVDGLPLDPTVTEKGYVELTGAGHAFPISANPQSGRCPDVDAHGTADNTAVAMWTCHGESDQVWTRRV
ncbi:hypothetical protein ALI22I_03045 [Saccharothrix sp. ALI-22-I]|uniref:RICIN domain-containing protein n=1 Tax=Saccharothrix sp. ALI-22-I TaxID=1933778 RepID=UPI00097C69BB|nr:RICIN domain-containing protein [Saccharothrix sp. ALI-22-I]ONI92580.1 hypothetical protein ALI22I_03045 [Saccharothrix sp. ALI-22-I]